MWGLTVGGEARGSVGVDGGEGVHVEIDGGGREGVYVGVDGGGREGVHVGVDGFLCSKTPPTI